MIDRMLKLPALAFVAACLSACSVAPAGETVHDPFEANNREIHAFNKSFIEKIPRGNGDGPGLPPEIKNRIVGFADTVSLPGMVLNGIMQGDVEGAVTNGFRFLFNSTVGVLGMFDPATTMGLVEHETDFGETLAVWGIQEGAYLEVAFLGPTTERALAGRVVDAIIDPLKFVGHPKRLEYATIGSLAAGAVKLSDASDTIDSVLVDSADSYAMLRLLYLQNRRYELGTTLPEESFDPYEDIYGGQ